MPELETPPTECVLTLTEAAVFLRVNDKALAAKAAAGEVPARQIGGEWRFLRRRLLIGSMQAQWNLRTGRLDGRCLVPRRPSSGISASCAITMILKPHWQTSQISGRDGRMGAIHDRLRFGYFHPVRVRP